MEPALRERNFGDYELTSCSNYDAVWAEDAKGTANRWGAAAGCCAGPARGGGGGAAYCNR